MRHHRTLALMPLFLCCILAAAKGKNKVSLPTDVLQARTALVWRYSAQAALDSPGVPAVEKFRKAIA